MLFPTKHLGRLLFLIQQVRFLHSLKIDLCDLNFTDLYFSVHVGIYIIKYIHIKFFCQVCCCMSVSELVFNRVSRLKRGIPFSIEKFYTLGTNTSVQKAMSRLAKEGKIIRVAKGIYSRPKPLATLSFVKIIAKAEDVAKTWAQLHHYKLAPQGLEAAYRLGLQTQAPIKSIYWTTGPSREFKIGHEVVQVKHTAATKLRWENKPEGMLLRGLLIA